MEKHLFGKFESFKIHLLAAAESIARAVRETVIIVGILVFQKLLFGEAVGITHDNRRGSVVEFVIRAIAFGAYIDFLVEESGMTVKPVGLEHSLVNKHTGSVAVGHAGFGIVLHPCILPRRRFGGLYGGLGIVGLGEAGVYDIRAYQRQCDIVGDGLFGIYELEVHGIPLGIDGKDDFIADHAAVLQYRCIYISSVGRFGEEAVGLTRRGGVVAVEGEGAFVDQRGGGIAWSEISTAFRRIAVIAVVGIIVIA